MISMTPLCRGSNALFRIFFISFQMNRSYHLLRNRNQAYLNYLSIYHPPMAQDGVKSVGHMSGLRLGSSAQRLLEPDLKTV